MADAVAIASVGASAVVALGVPFVSARLDRGRMLLQERRGALDELRGVLDEAALAMSHARASLEDLELAAERAQAPSSTREDADAAERAAAAASAALRAVADQEARSAVRLGSAASATLAYTSAAAALRDELAVLASAIVGGPSSADPEGWREVVGALAEARNRFNDRHGEFLDHAASLVGPRG